MKLIVNNKQANPILGFVRDVFMSIIVIWLTSPYQDFFSNWYIYGALWIGWILFAFTADAASFINTFFSITSIVAFLWPVCMWILSLFDWAAFALYQFTIPFILLSLVYYIKGKHITSLRFFTIIYLVYVLMININSIGVLEQNGEVARILANSNKTITSQFAGPFMANFQHTNNVSVLSVICLIYIKFIDKSKFLKVISIIILSINVVLLIYAQYAIALFTLIIFSFGVLWTGKSVKEKSVKLVITAFIMIITFMFLGPILTLIAERMDAGYLSRRLSAIAQLLSLGGIKQESDLAERLRLYILSVKTFFGHFFFGVGGSVYGANGIVGGHSTFLDNFAYYGVLVGTYFVSYIKTTMKNIKEQFQPIYQKMFLFPSAMFCFYMLVNTAYSEPMLFAAYFMYPALIYLLYVENAKEA